MARGTQIDDAQAGVTEGANTRRRRPKPAIVRTTVSNAPHHRVDRSHVYAGCPVHFASYAAHVPALVSCRQTALNGNAAPHNVDSFDAPVRSHDPGNDNDDRPAIPIDSFINKLKAVAPGTTASNKREKRALCVTTASTPADVGTSAGLIRTETISPADHEQDAAIGAEQDA